MAFFRAPVVEWLYSGVTKTKASKPATFSAQARVRLAVLPHGGRHHLVEVRQVVVLEVDQLELGVAPLGGEFVDPARDGFADAPGAGGTDDDCDFGHGRTFRGHA